MSSNIIAMVQIAKPSIEDAFKGFLEEESKRLASKTLRRYKEVIGLLTDHLNNYGTEPLSNAEKAFFEKHYNAEGEAHRDFCDIFGPEMIFRTLDSFFDYYMIRKVMAGEELKRASGTVVKKLSKYLAQNGFITEETAAEGMEEGGEAASVLPIAEKASRILGDYVENQGLYFKDFEKEEDDYMEFDHFTISKLEPGQIWFELYDEGKSKKFGPISVPETATKLLKEGWDISCSFGRSRGKWQMIEVANVYPN